MTPSFLPPASVVEVIEPDPSFCMCLVCESYIVHHLNSTGLHVSIHHNKKTFGQKDCTLGGRGRCMNAQAFSFALILKITLLKVSKLSHVGAKLVCSAQVQLCALLDEVSALERGNGISPHYKEM